MILVRRLPFLLAVLSLLLTVLSAGAQSSAAQKQAADLKQAGDDALTRKSYVEALDDYEKSYALIPNPALLYNRGRALQFLARYPEAVDALDRFVKEAPPDLKAKVPQIDDLVTELRGKVATLTVRSNAGGTLLVGGRDMGTAPTSQPVRVNAGKTTIEVIADGYFPFRQDVDLPGGRSSDITATLGSRDTFGYLVVRSHIVDSRVFVDGRGIGVVPAEAPLAAGPHPVRVDHEGYSASETQVVITKGERKELMLDPVKGRSVATRWWFWTIIGVAVLGAAAAVTVVALTTEKPAPSGNFSPGQVSF